MTVKDVSTYLNMDIDLIYTKCRRGEIPYFKVGGQFKFKKVEMIKLLQKMGFSETDSIDRIVTLYLQNNNIRPTQP
jgi:excisionase family DNA binding protein